MNRGTSSAYRRELLQTVQLHIDARAVEAKRQFNMVLGTGISMIIFGSGSFWALSELREQTRVDGSIYLFPVLLSSWGSAICSLSPIDQLDLDIIIASNPRRRTIACLVIILGVGGAELLTIIEYFQCDYAWFVFLFLLRLRLLLPLRLIVLLLL